MESSKLEAVISVFTEKAGECIPLDVVIKWMKSQDVEVLGALDTFLFQKNQCLRVQPRIPISEQHRFKLRYLKHCLVSNSEGQWADNRISAAQDLYSWFVMLWKEKAPSSFLNDLVQLLEELYKNGDEELRNCLVGVTLEHLFEKRSIRNLFRSWKADTVLREAYSQAMQWVDDDQIVLSQNQDNQTPPRLQRSRNVEELAEDAVKNLEGYAAQLREVGRSVDAEAIEEQVKQIRSKIQRHG